MARPWYSASPSGRVIAKSVRGAAGRQMNRMPCRCCRCLWKIVISARGRIPKIRPVQLRISGLVDAPRPIAPPGAPFPSGFTDLQSWTRDQFLEPDWLRVGTDTVGGNPAPTFNAAFTLNGVTVPAPLAGAGLLGLIFAGGCLLALARRRRRQLVA
jgi:hypothetical protein